MTIKTAIAVSAVSGAVGVNTHIDFASPGYGDGDLHTMIAAVKYLGVTRLRDCPAKDADLAGPRAWSVVAAATGCSFLPFIGETSPANAPTHLARYAPLAAQGILDGVEGPNEWDAAFAVAAGATLPAAAAFLQQVFAAGRALKLPVVNISFGAGWHAPDFQGNYPSQGDLSSFCDYGNAHTYPQPGQSVEFSLQRLSGLAKLAASSRPVITSEIGWPASQFPNQGDVARFVLFAVLDAAFYGNARVYFYALFDDVAGRFGLMNSDGTAKPSGTALRNLLAILRDSGAPAQLGSLDVTLSGGTANDRALLMQRSNGDFLLALWNEADAAHSVVVTLASPAAAAALYDPLAGPAPVQSFTNVSSVTVILPTHPLILAISGSGIVVTPPPAAQTPTGITLIPASVTIADSAVPGTPVASVQVATSDGLPFAGSVWIDAPFDVGAGGGITLAAALPPGPASLSPVVTASENGVSRNVALAVTVSHVAPPPPPPPPPPVTLTPHPLFGPPPSLLCGVGQILAVVGIAVSDQYAVGHAGTMALLVETKTGMVMMHDAAGTPYPGAGTNRIALAADIVTVNAALATLSYKSQVAGPDALLLTIFDQAGISARLAIPIIAS